MKSKTTLITVVAFGLLIGLGAKSEAEQKEVSKAEKRVEVDATEHEEDRRYYGEALNMSDDSGKIFIYGEANRGSGVVEELADHDTVEVIDVVPYGWLKIRLEDGREGYAESRMIRAEEIPPHRYGIREEGYTIHYSEVDQELKLYRDGELVLQSKGSSGEGDNFTPKGVFQVDRNHSGEEAYVQKFGQGYRYYISFYEAEYLLHSVPFSKEGHVIPEENRKLGSPASHGCIRLPLPVSKYIYDNVPAGSLVIIE